MGANILSIYTFVQCQYYYTNVPSLSTAISWLCPQNPTLSFLHPAFFDIAALEHGLYTGYILTWWKHAYLKWLFPLLSSWVFFVVVEKWFRCGTECCCWCDRRGSCALDIWWVTELATMPTWFPELWLHGCGTPVSGRIRSAGMAWREIFGLFWG